MTTTDRFEPYLEPLYIPVFFFLLTWIFNGYFREVSYSFQNGHLYTDLVFTGLFLTVVSSVIVVVYELLLIFKVVKTRVLLDGRMKIYSFVRWILGAAGFVTLVFSIWLIVMLVLTLSSGSWLTFSLD